MNELRGYGEGVGRIRRERCRQITAEGYTPEHDDAFVNGELALAAACYAASATGTSAVVVDAYTLEDAFPWEPEHDKRDEHDRIRQLEIAGALIAAELDRLLRVVARHGDVPR